MSSPASSKKLQKYLVDYDEWMIDPMPKTVKEPKMEQIESSGPLMYTSDGRPNVTVKTYTRPLPHKIVPPPNKRAALQLCRPPKQMLRLAQLPKDPRDISLSTPIEKLHGIIKSEELPESTTVQQAMSYMKAGIPDSVRKQNHQQHSSGPLISNQQEHQQQPQVQQVRTYVVKNSKEDRLMQILHNAELETKMEKRQAMLSGRIATTQSPPKIHQPVTKYRVVAQPRVKSQTVSRQFALQNGVSQRQFAYVHAEQSIHETEFDERRAAEEQMFGGGPPKGTTHGVVTSFESKPIVRIKSFNKREAFNNISGLGESTDDDQWISSVDITDFQGICDDLLGSGIDDDSLSHVEPANFNVEPHHQQHQQAPPPQPPPPPPQHTQINTQGPLHIEPRQYIQQQQRHHQVVHQQQPARPMAVASRGRPSMASRREREFQDELYPKPTWSYSSLIALALKNSPTGQLTVSEIYAFILDNFPYFRTAPPGWKNSVRHNLSLNKCFQKVEGESSHQQRKSCLWMICPNKMDKLDADIRKSTEKGFVDGLENPDDLEAIESGLKGMPDMDIYVKGVLKNSYNDNVRTKVDARQYHHDVMSTSSSQQQLGPMTMSISTDSRSPSPLMDFHQETLDAIASIEDDMDSSPFCIKPDPDICNMSDNMSRKRGYCDMLHSPNRTPPRTPEREDPFNMFESSRISPIRYTCGGSFDMVRGALNENSLLSAALEESPYKGPVTFPVLS